MRNINRSTLRYFLVWLVIVPPGLFYVWINHPPMQVNGSYIAIFVILSFLTIYFPIVRKGTPILLVMWLTIPAFLLFGLFVEVVIMQIAILAILFSVSSPVTLPMRFFFNSTLFFILSFLSALAFYLVGGEVGSVDFWPVLLSVFVYQMTHTVVNDVLMKQYVRYKRIQFVYASSKVLVDYAAIIAAIPLALALYFMLDIIGIGAFLLLSIPYFFVTLIVRLYNNSEKINRYLREAGEIGHEISDKMTEKEVTDQFVSKVSAIFNTDFAYLFDNQDGWLELICSYESKQFRDIEFQRLAVGEGLAGKVYEENKPAIYSVRGEWVVVARNYTPGDMESVLCVPITRNQKVEGVLLLGSKKKAAFQEYQLQILDLLCSYFTVSVEKARYMQEAVTKSERCVLTGLYNYTYLEEALAYQMQQLHNHVYKDLSVVMLDIDYFKMVNDTYGHQSGNDILSALARKLEAALPVDGIVGRYGGEEFVYILPGISKAEAAKFAEDLRAEIGGHDFVITPDLDDQKQQTVHITCSIGVSSAPEDTDEAMVLLRNVDRALYIGAKQAGRNRVATYVK